MKAIVVTDFAYKGLKRSGRGTGRQGLKATLQYLQYRDTRNNRLARSRSYERWQDRGLGVHHREIFAHCEQLKSQHVLAWTWVISPAPDLMELVPPSQRRDLLSELTERVVEDYYTERGFDVPEYAYILHRASTKPQDGEPPREHLHAHVVLPGTAPSAADRIPVYNNATKGHDRLFREVATGHFAALLDERSIDWRSLRPEPDNDHPLTFTVRHACHRGIYRCLDGQDSASRGLSAAVERCAGGQILACDCRACRPLWPQRYGGAACY